MKQGKSITTFVMILIAAAMVCYFGVYLFNGLRDPFSTTYVYEYTVNDSVFSDAIIVRNEQVLPPQNGILDVQVAEGERVARGQTVALVYRDNQALETQSQLNALSAEAEVLRAAMSREFNALSSARLDEMVLQSAVTLKSSYAAGSYSDLDGQVLQLKSAVLKRDYTYSDSLSADALQAQLNEITAQHSALASSAAATAKVTASTPGTYSVRVDGYESVLTTENMLDLTADQISDLLRRNISIDDLASGKIILGNVWYLALNLPADQAARLTVDGTIPVQFTGDFNRTVTMTVKQMQSTAEGESVAVLLSSDRFLGEITLLRRQTVELIFDTYAGMRVPKMALRMLTTEKTDADSSEITTTSTLGVYALVAGKLEFKPVEIIIEGSDFFVVRSTVESGKALKPGDEIVVRGTNLAPGLLIEY